MELIINNKVYDISKFKHPGGNIINYYLNEDATNAFNQFHMKSKKAIKILDSLPHRYIDNYKQPILINKFEELSNILKKEKYFDTNYYEVIYRCFEIFFMVYLGFYLYKKIFLFSCIILGIASGRGGWLMHEAGHYSFSGNIQLDKCIQTFFYGSGCGMSAIWWRSKHNRHHACPQHQDKDPDLLTLPLIAFNKCVIHDKMYLTTKIYIKFQTYLFPIITCTLVSLYWRYFLHIKTTLIKLYDKKNKNYAIGELLSYILYHYLFYNLLYETKNKITTYLFINSIASSYIFINFAVSHSHLQVTKKNLTWVEYAAYHTTNVGKGHWFISWWMSNLNYQIEHHLFPSMPQCNHKYISSRVKDFFKKNDLPYYDGNYLDILSKTFNNLNEVSKSIK